MSVITPARLISAANMEYEVRGHVLRVLDTNGSGELIPVVHKRLADGKFSLNYVPYGKIYAEVMRHDCHAPLSPIQQPANVDGSDFDSSGHIQPSKPWPRY